MRFTRTDQGIFMVAPRCDEERKELEYFSRGIRVGHSIRFHFFRSQKNLGLKLTIVDSGKKIFLCPEEYDDTIVLGILECLEASIGNILSFLGISGEKTCAMALAFPPPQSLPRRLRHA